MIGWRPPFGTLNGMDYMQQGSYTLPQGDHQVALAADWEAIQWLLNHVQGNHVIAESYEVDYYQKGGTRVASMTGLSGLSGMHEGEQRDGESLGQRDLMFRELWDSQDIARTQQLLNELQVDYVYVGELERYYHPEGAAKMERMAAEGLLQPVFRNAQVTIYATARVDG